MFVVDVLSVDEFLAELLGEDNVDPIVTYRNELDQGDFAGFESVLEEC